jgi:S-phase kinase-associated protein 1
MDNSDNYFVNLVSSESYMIPIDIKAAKKSNFINCFLNDFPNEDIKFDKINYSTLKKVAEYLEHYKDSEPKEIQPLPKKDFKDCIDMWDYEYINLSSENIFEIMLAANFMDIKPLLELTCAKIASVIKGKSPKEIQDLLNIESDCIEDEENSANETGDED